MDFIVEGTKGPTAQSRKSSVNARTNLVQNHRKRTSSTFDDISVTSTTFDAVTLSGVTNQRTFTFVHVSTLLRAHVPLSWLSGSTSFSIAPGTLLRANIVTVPRWEYHVLIANLASSRALFAFERVDIDVYICYPLQAWVKPQWVEQASVGAAPVIDLSFFVQPQDACSHSRKPSNSSTSGVYESQPIPTSPKIPTNRRGHLARLSILESREKLEELTRAPNEDTQRVALRLETHSTSTTVDQFQTREILEKVIICNSPTSIPSQSAHVVEPTDQIVLETRGTEDLIPSIDHLSTDHLRCQYFETLYLSKTSLAFFAKGPMSRARARSRMPKASKTPNDLVDYYTESVLSIRKLDLKYRESVQNMLMTHRGLGNDAEPAKTKKTSRKNARMKIGKDGLWPLEADYIAQWWKSQELAGGRLHMAEAQQGLIKNFVSQLRTRETEMQILLILEILALEARDIPSQSNVEPVPDADVKVESIETDNLSVLPKASIPKKKRNLNAELDFLVDRLCIWHSVGSEEISVATENALASEHSPEKLQDRLRDFCKDVVVPFYGGKLPELCQSICAKMGGSEVSPRRTKPETRRETNRQPPGTAIGPERPSNKRTLQRVLSEEQGSRRASPPSLSRSATLPGMVPNLKRESTERPMSRSSMNKSMSFSNREVDLVADAKATAAKRRKLDLVEAQKRELNAAIETLKRPNRSTLAKSFMDDVERRTKDNKAAIKKIEPIQISATPRRNRTRPVGEDEYDLPPIKSGLVVGTEAVIPLSTIKPRGLSQAAGIPQASAKKKAVLSAIHDTPSKAMGSRAASATIGRGQHLGRHDLPNEISSSTLIASTPATSRLRADLDNVATTPLHMSRSLKPVILTPIRRSEVSIEKAFKDVPEIPAHAGKMMDRVMGPKNGAGEMSLYDSLGWNDDYDLCDR